MGNSAATAHVEVDGLAVFDFDFPRELIAQYPARERDQARLMVVERTHGEIHHRRFSEIDGWLNEGDALVINDSRVVPARLQAHKEGGGAVELLVLGTDADGTVSVMFRSRGGLRPATQLALDDGTPALVIAPVQNGRCRLDLGGVDVARLLAELGRVPLPPYIKRPPEPLDEERYQTVFARRDGSVAAPTAGLHFSDRLLTKLKRKGVLVRTVTLHVGPGTFVPVRGDLDGHEMEAELCRVGATVADELQEVRNQGRRIVAVGTTSVRTLESACRSDGRLGSFQAPSSLFIRPGYAFRVVDALVTNFHLPRTTPICLLLAFAGPELLRRAYDEAVRERYRFYSYGDAMLVV
ncbi:MAG: tRNA preQ1(34) S-adenosylmethionine ribosyltransferase-isomerase QueA [Candidatus Binatia bacterium]